MAFLIRKISTSATGKEIARESRVEGERLGFGRDPSSDLHLTDLAVALHHGTIERKGPNLEIEAAEGIFIEIDGRMAPSGTIPVAAGGGLRIASHLLEIMPAAPEAEDVEIVVTQAGAGGESAEPADSRSFSLAATRLSKRPVAWALAILVLAVFLAWPIWSFYERRQAAEEYRAAFNADRLWLSGSLSEVHSALRDDCQACHVQPFVAVRDEACLACHGPGRAQGQRPHPPVIDDHAELALLAQARPAPSGWGRVQRAFQDAFGFPRERCADCHTEHEGPQEMPPTAQAFCTECHADMRSRLPRTELADASDFAAPRAQGERPHPEFRPLVQVVWHDGAPAPEMRRVPLGADRREGTNLRFPHELHLREGGSVAQMGRRLAAAHGFGPSLECADCHVPTPDGVRFQPVSMEGDCRMCHSLTFDRIDGVDRTLRHGEPQQVVADLREFYRNRGPQRPAELSPASRRRPGGISQIRAAVQYARARAGAGAAADRAIRAVFEPNGACYACHQVIAPPAGSLAYRIRPVAFQPRYMFNGWFDHRTHRIVQLPGRPALTGSDACVACHTESRSSAAATDLMIPDQASCTQCHGGERSNAAVPSGCAMCHDYHADEGQPAMLIRRQARGRRWDTNLIRVPDPGDGR